MITLTQSTPNELAEEMRIPIRPGLMTLRRNQLMLRVVKINLQQLKCASVYLLVFPQEEDIEIV